MIALLRKDSLWLLACATGGTLIYLIALVTGVHAHELWMKPEDLIGVCSLNFHWVAGTLLGIAAGLLEDVTGTGDYLGHRPISAARIFWTRQLGCAIVIALWILVVPSLHLVGTFLFLHDAVVVESARWWDFVDTGTVGFAFYAAAVFCTQFVRRPLLGALLAAAVSVVLLGLLALVRFTEVASWLATPISPLALILAALLLWAASHTQREGRDLDRPIGKARLGAAAGLLIGTSLGLAALAGALQLEARRNLLRFYPRIARFSDGTIGLISSASKWGPVRRADDDHHLRAEFVTDAQIIWQPRSQPPFVRPSEVVLWSRWRKYHRARYEALPCLGPWSCYLGADGRFRLLRLGDQALIRTVGKGSDAAPFSAEAVPIGDWIGAALIGDPADGRLWRLDLTDGAGAFTSVPLPDGDRYVENLTGRLAPVPESTRASIHPTIVRGEHGIYEGAVDGFRIASAEVREAVARLIDEQHIAVSILGPESFLVRVPAASGAAEFSHLYQPRLLSERALVWQGRALSLLRPPVLELASLVEVGTTPVSRVEHADATIFLDPLVALGVTELVGLDLLLAVALATLTLLRLRRLGAPLPRRLAWTGVVLATGPLGFLCQHLLETGRGWRAVAPAPAEPARPLLIQTI